MWDGVEHADSLIVNAHKWLGAVFDSTLYFVRDPEHLVRVMSTNPSYLQTAADGRVKNYRDWGLPLGRRFRALEVVVPDSRAGRRRPAGAPAPRHRQREVARRSRSPRRPTGACWRRCRCRRCACVTSPPGLDRRGARPAHARLGGAHQSVGRSLRHAGDARRPLDGARLDRRGTDRARARRATVGADGGDG